MRENLRKVDCDLVIENARPVESIKKLVEACQKLSKPVVAVVYQKEVTFEELNVEKVSGARQGTLLGPLLFV